MYSSVAIKRWQKTSMLINQLIINWFIQYFVYKKWIIVSVFSLFHINFSMIENLENPLNFDSFTSFYGSSGEVTTISQSSMFGALPKYWIKSPGYLAWELRALMSVFSWEIIIKKGIQKERKKKKKESKFGFKDSA